MANPKDPTPTEVDSLKGKAWTAAARDLREKYTKDWETFLRARYHEYGLDWNPRKTKEQREKDQLAELLERYPEEAQRILTNDGDPS
jgi:hypothetical protein